MVYSLKELMPGAFNAKTQKGLSAGGSAIPSSGMRNPIHHLMVSK
jgi:hypothetical protein